MKTNTRSHWIMLLLCMVLFISLFQLAALTAHAQEIATGTATALAPGAAASPLDGAIDAVAGKYGWLVTVLSVVGILRLVFKPIFSIAHTVVENTATTKDDEYLDKVEKSAVVKAISWVLDYVGSIKLGKPAAK